MKSKTITQYRVLLKRWGNSRYSEGHYGARIYTDKVRAMRELRQLREHAAERGSGILFKLQAREVRTETDNWKDEIEAVLGKDKP